MACAARRDLGVALLDLDIQFGSAAFLMDISSSASIVDLVATPDRLDAAMVKGAMVRPHARFDLLCAPAGVHPMEDLTAAGITKVIDIARDAYGAVLIDIPMAWNDWTYAALSKSDHIVL